MSNEQPASQPRATVIVTVCDRQSLGSRAIRSALAQSEPGIEVIVVDDASEPRFHLEDRDRRLRAIRMQTRRGVCAARNVGLREARGEWITFLDDDDELEPDMLERSLAAAGGAGLPAPVAVISAVTVANGDGPPQIHGPSSSPRGRRFWLEPGMDVRVRTLNTLVVPTATMLEIGGWDERLRAWEHEDLFLRLYAVCSIRGLDEPTYRMFDHSGARNHHDWLAMAEGIELTLRKHRALFRSRRASLAHHLATMGVAYLRAGRWGPAVRSTSHALVIRPTRGRYYRWWAAAVMGPRLFERARRMRRVLRRETTTS